MDSPAPRRRRTGERRVTPTGHQATDAVKVTCPFCGSSESAVRKSRGGIQKDKVHRRRECVECGKRFPTSERIDWELLERELETRGEASAPRQALPLSWASVEQMFHELWGQSKDGRYIRRDWNAMQQLLDGLKRAS